MKLQYLALVGVVTALGVGVTVAAPSGFQLKLNSAIAAPCAANPCAANPCAANPCAANPCAANPCAAKPVNPCAANPCAANPCAAKPANPCAANPCASAGDPMAAADSAPVAKAVENASADYKLEVQEIDGANVIELTQAPCQFLESEGVNQDYTSTSADDCKTINADTAATRTAQPLTLPAGDYTFRVTNQGVPYEVGFYLRGAGVGSLTLPKVSGGGLTEGATKDYTIALKPGEYVYSCPLNPTLNYPLTVTES